MKVTITQQDIKTFFYIVLYRVLLEYIFFTELCTTWGYYGFKSAPEILTYIVSWVALLLLIPVVISYINKINRPSSIIFLIITLINAIPGTVILAYQPTTFEFKVLWLIYWTLLSLNAVYLPPVQIKKPSEDVCSLLTEIFYWLFVSVVLFVWVVYAHCRITFNILTVYSIRHEAATYNLPTIIDYLLAASRSIIPCFCVYRLARKQYKYFAFTCAVQIANFSIDGLKSSLFALLISIPCYFLYTDEWKVKIPKYLVGLNVVAVLEMIVLKTGMIVGVFIRRVLFLPSYYNVTYYNFFSDPSHPFDYFKQSFMRNFGFNSAYGVRIPFLMGEYMGGTHIGEYANNGLFSDAYCNLGVIGIFLMPLIVVVVVKLLDSCSTDLPIGVLIGGVVAHSMTLISSGLTVFAVTQGFLLTCLVVLCMPKRFDPIQIEREC